MKVYSHGQRMWTDSVLCGHRPRGEDFPVYTAAGGVVPCKQRYVIHVTGGLEPLSAQEVAEVPGCADVHCLLGKVLFSSNAPLETLRGLRSAEMLSLLCLALPPPAMPGETPQPAHVPDREGEREGEREREGEGEREENEKENEKERELATEQEKGTGIECVLCR